VGHLDFHKNLQEQRHLHHLTSTHNSNKLHSYGLGNWVFGSWTIFEASY
jgi:hypothetical protein